MKKTNLLAMLLSVSVLLVLIVVQPVSAQGNVQHAFIYCDGKFFHSGETDPNRNILNVHDDINWHVFGAKGTIVKIDFGAKTPFSQNDFTTTVVNRPPVIRATVEHGAAEGEYKYSVTCTPPDGAPWKIDPIIEVPPHP